ncbi:MAG: aminopeptidase [Gammaproteobacteria bacterium]
MSSSRRKSIGKLSTMKQAFRTVGVIAVGLVLGGCETVGFYGQAVSGQLEILMKRRSLDKVIADDDTPEEVHRKLELVSELVAYARDELSLPADGQYESYSDLERDYVVWNVFAAPELSLEPKQWCYPIAGCASYRGYFDETAAREYGARLADEGFDVYVGGVAAYSTLGWFDDPVLNTFLGRSEAGLAALIFHELAHALLYVPGDTTFNESFATAVEEEGLRRWFAARENPSAFDAYVEARAQRRVFLELVSRWTDALEALYAAELPDAQKRERKAQTFEGMRDEYRRLESASETEGPRVQGFGAFFDEGLNNARLISVSAYRSWGDAFRALLDQADGDLEAFYARCRELAELDAAARRERLEALSS